MVKKSYFIYFLILRKKTISEGVTGVHSTNHVWKVTVPERFKQARIGLWKARPHLCSELSGPAQLGSQFLFRFFFEEESETETNLGASGERNCRSCALAARSSFPSPVAPAGPRLPTPHPARPRAPRLAPVCWRLPGRSSHGCPLRPSWPRLLSPHEWTVPSLSSSSAWRSPQAACRTSAPPALVRTRRSCPPRRRQKYIPLARPAACRCLSAPPRPASKS